MKKTLFILLVSIVLFSCKKEDESEAIYEVTFNINWTENTFPLDYPANAHFSRLVGWSHAEAITYLTEGTEATEGIRLMAEGGRTTPMDEEINALIENKEGLELILGENLATGEGSISVDVKVTKDFPAISLVTMIAPSPDWYVGVINQSMLNSNGTFQKEMVFPLNVYDSGTDNGNSFEALNDATQPKGVIMKFENTNLGNSIGYNGNIGTVTFKRK